MPTSNPRINVTLSPSLDQLVGHMALHQRVSKSQVLRELLEAAEPALQRAVALMKAASEASAEVRKGFARSLDKSVAKSEKAAAAVLADMDARTVDLVAMAQRVRGRRPARLAPAPGAPVGAGAGVDPPRSKRGVRKSAGAVAGRAPKAGKA